MQTMEKAQSTDTPTRSADRNLWLLVAMALLAIAVVVLGSLWLAERSTVSDLNDQLAAAEVASNEAASASHPRQAEVRALYEDFITAIADPDAERIASLLAPGAVNVSAGGVRSIGAEAIGDVYQNYGPLEVVNAGELIVNGQTRYRAAMTGQVDGVDGLLVTKIVPTQDGLKFSEIVWYGG